MITPVCPIDRVIVKIDKKYQDEVSLKSGGKLGIDTRINDNEHSTLHGTVVSVPHKLKRPDIALVKPELKVGDEVYFSYIVVFDQDQTRTEAHHRNEFKVNGETYWLVDYTDVFFAKRGDEIKMIGGWVLVEPFVESRTLSLLELPDHLKNVERKDMGKVLAIGEPKLTKPLLHVEQGDLVRFNGRYVQQYYFEGLSGDKKYIVKQERILSKL